MSFWGVEISPGIPYTHRHDGVGRRLRISQATIADRSGGPFSSRSVLQCSVGNKNPVYMCSLTLKDFHSCQLDLEFEESEDVVFSVKGPRGVHLAGYFVKSSDTDAPKNRSAWEDIEENRSKHSSFISKENDNVIKDSFIDDSEHPTCAPGRVTMEELDDGNSKQLEKFMTRSNEASQQQHVMERKDEGGKNKEDNYHSTSRIDGLLDASVSSTEVGAKHSGMVDKKKNEEVTELMVFEDVVSNHQNQAIGDGNGDICQQDEFPRIYDHLHASVPSTEVGAEHSGMLEKNKNEEITELMIFEDAVGNNHNQAIGHSNGDICKQDEYSSARRIGDQSCDASVPSTGVEAGQSGKLKKNRNEKVTELMIFEDGICNQQNHAIGDSIGDIGKRDEYHRVIDMNIIGDKPENQPNDKQKFNDFSVPKIKRKRKKIQARHEVLSSEDGKCLGNMALDLPVDALESSAILQDKNACRIGDQTCDALVPSTGVGAGQSEKLKKKRNEKVTGLMIFEDGVCNQPNQAIADSSGDIGKRDEYPRVIDMNIIGDKQENQPNDKQKVNDFSVLKSKRKRKKIKGRNEGLSTEDGKCLGKMALDLPVDALESSTILQDKKIYDRLDASVPSTEVGAEHSGMQRKKKNEVITELMIFEDGFNNNQNQAIGHSNGDICKQDEYPRVIDVNIIGDKQENQPNDKQQVNDFSVLKSKMKRKKIKGRNEGLSTEDGKCLGKMALDLPVDALESSTTLQDKMIYDHLHASVPSTEVGAEHSRMLEKNKNEEITELMIFEDAVSNNQNQAIGHSNGDICKQDEYSSARRIGDQSCDTSMPSTGVGAGQSEMLKKNRNEKVTELMIFEDGICNQQNLAIGDSNGDIGKRDEYPRVIDMSIIGDKPENQPNEKQKVNDFSVPKIKRKRKKIKARNEVLSSEAGKCLGNMALDLPVDALESSAILQDNNACRIGDQTCDALVPSTGIGAGQSEKLKKKRNEKVTELMIIEDGVCNQPNQAIGDSNGDIGKRDEYPRVIDMNIIGDKQENQSNDEQKVNDSSVLKIKRKREKIKGSNEGLSTEDGKCLGKMALDLPVDALESSSKLQDKNACRIVPYTGVGAGQSEKLKKKRNEKVTKLMIFEDGVCNQQNQAIGDSNGDIGKRDDYPRVIDMNIIGDKQENQPNDKQKVNDFSVPKSRSKRKKIEGRNEGLSTEDGKCLGKMALDLPVDAVESSTKLQDKKIPHMDAGDAVVGNDIVLKKKNIKKSKVQGNNTNAKTKKSVLPLEDLVELEDPPVEVKPDQGDARSAY